MDYTSLPGFAREQKKTKKHQRFENISISDGICNAKGSIVLLETG